MKMTERQRLLYERISEAVDVAIGEVAYNELVDEDDYSEEVGFADKFFNDVIVALDKVREEL